MLFVFEGPDNAGKSTLINNIEDRLILEKVDFTSIKEPSNRTFGQLVTNIHKKKQRITKELELSIMAYHTMDRYDLIFDTELMNKILSHNHIVLADRSLISTLAYQVFNSCFFDNVLSTFINSHESLLKIVPDRTYYLRVPPKHIFENEKNEDLYESRKLQQKIRENYDFIFKYETDTLYDIVKSPLLENYISTKLILDVAYVTYDDLENIVYSDISTFI